MKKLSKRSIDHLTSLRAATDKWLADLVSLAKERAEIYNNHSEVIDSYLAAQSKLDGAKASVKQHIKPYLSRFGRGNTRITDSLSVTVRQKLVLKKDVLEDLQSDKNMLQYLCLHGAVETEQEIDIDAVRSILSNYMVPAEINGAVKNMMKQKIVKYNSDKLRKLLVDKETAVEDIFDVVDVSRFATFDLD